MKAELDALVDQMITSGILFEEAVKEFEKRFILSVLSRNHHNLCRAASELGIHRNTLSKRLQEYQDDRTGHREKPLYSNLQRRRVVAPRHKSRA